MPPFCTNKTTRYSPSSPHSSKNEDISYGADKLDEATILDGWATYNECYKTRVTNLYWFHFKVKIYPL